MRRPDGPGARLEAWIRLLRPGAAASIAGLLFYAWVSTGGLRTAGEALGRWGGAFALVGGLVVAGALVVAVPAFAWRAGKAATASGLHAAARLAFASALAPLAVLSAGLLALVAWMAWTVVLAEGSLAPSHYVGVALIAGTGVAAAGCALGALRRLRAGAAFERALPPRLADRALWYLFDLSGPALALVRDGALEDGERLLFSLGDLHVTSRRLIAARRAPPFTVEGVLRAELLEARATHDEESLELRVECRLAGGETRRLVTAAWRPCELDLATLAWLLSGELPEDARLELDRARQAAQPRLAAGEELVVAIPDRRSLAPRGHDEPSETAGMALTTRRLLRFDAVGVARSIDLEKGWGVSVREILGTREPWRELVVRAFPPGRPGRALRFPARTLDALVLLGALLERAEEAAFLPSLLAEV